MLLSLSTLVMSNESLMLATSLFESWPRVSVIVLLETDSVSFRFLLISALMSFKMVDTLTVVISDDGRKNTTIIRTSASAKMSQMKLVLTHFPPLDIGVPLSYPTPTHVRLPPPPNLP